MNGLEQILLKIEEDNNLEVQRILEDGRQRAEEYTKNAVAEASKEAQNIKDEAQKKAALMIESAKTGCEAYVSKQELAAKSDVVSESIKYAVEQIKSMDDEKYFEAISSLILKYAQQGEGELMMNERDIAKMPKDYMKKINTELKKSDASLELYEVPANIDSGFIIRYGGVEENCTFDALVEDKIDEIKDKLYGQLKA